MVNFSFFAVNGLFLQWLLFRLSKTKQWLPYSFCMIFVSKLFFNRLNTEKASQHTINLTFIFTRTYW